MSIRFIARDRLVSRAPELSLVPAETIVAPVSDDPLVFYTAHTPPVRVDLREFRDGWRQPEKRYRRQILFRGRPSLIEELLPALRDRVMVLRPQTVRKILEALRAWWRFFDRLESAGSIRIRSVTQLNDTMGKLAEDFVSRKNFIDFRAIADETLQAMRRTPTFWLTPEKRTKKRRLAPEDHFARIWHALKHGWFASLNRATRLQELESGALPEQPGDEVLVQAIQARQRAQAFAISEGRDHWTINDLTKAASETRTDEHRPERELLSTLFITPTEVRMAFHLFLAGSRWNPSSALTLRVDTTPGSKNPCPFIRDFPGNPDRYVLVGEKKRGNSEPEVVGDWKTDRSPGAIVRSLVERTWPLRKILLARLQKAKADYLRAKESHTAEAALLSLYNKVQSLQEASTSVWLFVHKGAVLALNATTYSGTRNPKFLVHLVTSINKGLSPKSQVASIVASDFRDAFAAWAWRATGGSILQIQKELQHRTVGTTMVYLDNTRVNAESAQILRRLCDTVFDLFKSGRSLDLTFVARVMRDGSMSADDHKRLKDYRNLRRSRIGVGCLDPKNPPKHIDPEFVADGKSECSNHRCTLCLENAVIGPDSIEGLVMRAEELKWLKSNMPLHAFTFGRYQLELDRIDLALLAFELESVTEKRMRWRRLIDQGLHTPVQFN